MNTSLYGGRRRRRVHRRMGRGIFGDIGNVLKNIAGNVGTKFISSKLGLGRRRRRHTMGGRIHHTRRFTPFESQNYYSGLAHRIHPYLPGSHMIPVDPPLGAGRRRRRRRTGRGIVSSLLGLAGLGRRRHRRRHVGGRMRIPKLI